jgi:predicted XRE-type DNA-binding protein
MAQRPFNPDALKAHAISWLRPNVCNWSSVYRYTVLVPLEQVLDDGAVRFIATPDDLQNLELMFSCMRRRPPCRTSISRCCGRNCRRRLWKESSWSNGKKRCSFDGQDIDLIKKRLKRGQEVHAARQEGLGHRLKAPGLTQVQAAKRPGLRQPDVSKLANGRHTGFSTDRLLALLSTLEVAVEIVLRPRRKPLRQRGTIRVLEAAVQRPARGTIAGSAIPKMQALAPNSACLRASVLSKSRRLYVSRRPAYTDGAPLRGNIMATAQSGKTRSSDIAIFGRILSQHKRGMSADLARYVLTLGFTDADQARMELLAAANQQRSLSPDDREELMGYVKAGHLLALLHSNARQSLKKRKVS